MAKKEQEMYESMPVIEASDRKSMEKKLTKLEKRPEKIVVRISNKVNKIKNNAFPMRDSWDNVEKTNDIALVLIPDSVTEIGKCAFSGCTGLTSIVIPNSVTKIGDMAFYGCTGLTSIVIPDSVTKIGECAFEGCTGLTSIVIPDSVTEIGYDAFCTCEGLSNVVLSNSLTIINCNMFKCCSRLSQINIPDSVTEIRNNAFDRTELTSIVIPGSVTKIGSSAFSDCTGLTSIVIPDSVTKIGDYAFSDCTGLTSIVIPDSVTEIGRYAFMGCTGLTSIVIPDSVTEIGEYAFKGCTGLKNVTIPHSLTDIGDDAFPDSTCIIRREEKIEDTGISQNRVPMLKANLCNIDFKLTDSNIEAYRDTFDAATVVILWIDEASYIFIGGDLCDVLYDVRDKLKDEGIKINNVGKDYSLSYVNEYKFKNCQSLKLDYEGELNLIGAAAEALTGAEDPDANPIDVAILVKLGDSYFSMENNAYVEESTEEEFNKQWNS